MGVFLLICLAVVGSSGLESISKGQGSRIDPQNGANEVRLRVKINEKAEGKDRENLGIQQLSLGIQQLSLGVGQLALDFIVHQGEAPLVLDAVIPTALVFQSPGMIEHQKRENNKNQDEMKYQQ